jgi:hypothetical protein
MAKRDEVIGIMVVLLVDGQQSLFLRLGADGSINRMGNGSVDDIERQMFIGVVDPKLFLGLRARIGPGVLRWLGQHLTAPQPVGKLCELTVLFKYADGREAATEWRYGSESQGPYPDVCEFVAAAVEATEPWFESRKEMVRRNAAR